VLVGEAHRNLSDENCSQRFLNPGARIFIRDPRRAGEGKTAQGFGRKRASRQDEDFFTCESIYICFSSDAGCTLGVSCAFPKEEDRAANKGPVGARRLGTAKAIRGKFQVEIEA